MTSVRARMSQPPTSSRTALSAVSSHGLNVACGNLPHSELFISSIYDSRGRERGAEGDFFTHPNNLPF